MEVHGPIQSFSGLEGRRIKLERATAGQDRHDPSGKQTVQVSIIGGGIIGLSCALELARAGLEVRIFERGEFGGEASWAGGGILWPLYPWRYAAPVHALARWSAARYPQLCAELAVQTGVDPQWTRSGLLMLDQEMQEAARDWQRLQDEAIAPIDAPTLGQLEPLLTDQHRAALHFPQVAQVRNPRLLQALLAHLRQLGVELHPHEALRQWQVESGRILGFTTDRATYAASGPIVITSGAWSRNLLQDLSPPLPVRPVRGQMLLLQAQPGFLRHILLHRGHYAIPRRDGLIVFGSTLEDVGFDKSTTDSAHAALLEAARQIHPSLAALPILRHWAGLRPYAADGIPLIGRHPRLEGLYVNAGHYRNGLLMAPACAHLLTDHILGRPPIVDPRPYQLPDL